MGITRSPPVKEEGEEEFNTRIRSVSPLEPQVYERASYEGESRRHTYFSTTGTTIMAETGHVNSDSLLAELS
jgi:hypothetical protein